MLQFFYADVAKVDRDVARVAIVVHVCCKLSVPSVFIRVFYDVSYKRVYLDVAYVFRLMLQVFYLDVVYILQWFLSVFHVFFTSVLDACFKMFHLSSDLFCNRCI
jgi:hypothetical protein